MVQSSFSMLDDFPFQSNEDELSVIITPFLPLKIEEASQHNFKAFDFQETGGIKFE
jgi:hypothetical protein